MKLISIVKLIIAYGLCLSAGLAGSFFTTNLSGWYQSLNKPFFTPPNWLFAPVWTTLYLLMGVSAFIVWQKGFENRTVKIALGFFVVQLILNALWTPLFFGAKLLLAAFLEILLLWLAILATIINFKKVSTAAALLLIPYILWVSFAAVLTAAIYILN